jgi:RNA polymerase sigma-70 factor (ECF subfamily)
LYENAHRRARCLNHAHIMRERELSRSDVSFLITGDEIEKLRRKLLYKIRFDVGYFCPDVDDIAQETLTRFLRSAEEGKIRNPEGMGAFLNGICKNVIHEYRRRLWRETPYDSELRPERSTAPAAELLDLQGAIDAGLRQLSARDRKILQEFFLEERSKEEICRELGLSDGQFRVILFRAKSRFRQIYGMQVKQHASGGH